MEEPNPQSNDKSRLTILLSFNAVAIIIAGVLIASAIFNSGFKFRTVGERSDVIEDTITEMELLESASDSTAEVEYITTTGNDDYISTTSHEFDNTEVPSGELWNEKSITIYATPDTDICVSGSITDLGDMYWQTSNPEVISGFYNSARTWLGFDNKSCRFPDIAGEGTTVITAGSYDGSR